MREEEVLAKQFRDKGLTWKQVANKLNNLGFKTKKGLRICDKYASLLVINNDPSYRSYERKTKRRSKTNTNFKSLVTTPNELAIDLILSTKTISIKDRLEIALKLL